MKLENGRFFQKANIAPETLLQTSAAPRSWSAMGKTTPRRPAPSEWERVSPGHLRIDGLDFTPCDCNPLEAALEHQGLQGRRASGRPGMAVTSRWSTSTACRCCRSR